jgi:hypothetical protein
MKFPKMKSVELYHLVEKQSHTQIALACTERCFRRNVAKIKISEVASLQDAQKHGKPFFYRAIIPNGIEKHYNFIYKNGQLSNKLNKSKS